jgi:hypothetical protein
MLDARFQDGVANLLPGTIPLLLDVRIRGFEWDKGASVREVIDRLRQLPEVKEEALRLGLKQAPLEGAMGVICIRGDCTQRAKPEPAMETEEGASLLTVLNRVVLTHSGAVWSYAEYHCDKNVLFSLDVLSE